MLVKVDMLFKHQKCVMPYVSIVFKILLTTLQGLRCPLRGGPGSAADGAGKAFESCPVVDAGAD